MKNKGFTLVELLGVITIIAVLSLITVPTVDTIIRHQRDKLYDAQIDTIRDGLKTWGDDNASLLPEVDEEPLVVNLGLLKHNGFVDAAIKNPKTELCFANSMVLTITAVASGYKYTVDKESGEGGIERDCKEPSIETSIILKGDEIIKLQIGDSYAEPGYTAYNGSYVVNKTKVKTVITNSKGEVVSEINSLDISSSPYKIKYTYGNAVKERTVEIGY